MSTTEYYLVNTNVLELKDIVVKVLVDGDEKTISIIVISSPVNNTLLGIDKFYYNLNNKISSVNESGWSFHNLSTTAATFGDFILRGSSKTAGTGGISSPIVFTLTNGFDSIHPNSTGATIAVHIRLSDNCSGWVSDGTSTSFEHDTGCNPIPAQIIFLGVPPGGRIYINDVDTGINTSTIITSTMIDSLIPGCYKIRVTLSGYQDYTEELNLSSGSTVIIFAFMIPLILPTQKGNLNITVSPRRSLHLATNHPGIQGNISIPKFLKNIAVGDFGFIASNDSIETIFGSFRIEEGKTTNLNIPTILLSTNVGYVYMESIPPGARIYIDGIDYNANTAFSVMGQTEGSHTYEMRLSGYDSVSGQFTVTYGKMIVISRTLTRTLSEMGPRTNLEDEKFKFLEEAELEIGLEIEFIVENVGIEERCIEVISLDGITKRFTSLAKGANKYYWFFGDKLEIVDTSSNYIYHTYNKAGTYVVGHKACKEDICSSWCIKIIIVK